MFLVSICSHLCPIHWRQLLSREWRCGWSNADRRCSNDIWVTNTFIAYQGATYIRGLTILVCRVHTISKIEVMANLYKRSFSQFTQFDEFVLDFLFIQLEWFQCVTVIYCFSVSWNLGNHNSRTIRIAIEVESCLQRQLLECYAALLWYNKAVIKSELLDSSFRFTCSIRYITTPFRIISSTYTRESNGNSKSCTVDISKCIVYCMEELWNIIRTSLISTSVPSSTWYYKLYLQLPKK